jgi:hypothetical protein
MLSIHHSQRESLPYDVFSWVHFAQVETMVFCLFYGREVIQAGVIDNPNHYLDHYYGRLQRQQDWK